MGEALRTGAFWEGRARAHLEEAGLRVLERNYRCRLGEIDLVMEDGPCLVFVEVRYRARAAKGTGAETVLAAKQARIIRAARHFLAGRPRHATRPCRFDVVSITGRWQPRIAWIRHAFDAS